MSAEAGTYVPEPYPGGTMENAFNSALADVSRETSPDVPVGPEPEDGPDLLDAEAIAESLTGFDEIAIEQWFKVPFSKVATDDLKLLRSLYFIHLRRAEGATDKAAWRSAMEMKLGELQGKFAEGDDGADPDDEQARGERDRAYAEFVMVSGVPYTVEEYNGLTAAQKNAVYEVARKRK